MTTIGGRPVRIATIIGARPQFIKAAMVTRAIRRRREEDRNACPEELLINTGQHPDYVMSQVFMDTLELPAPRYNLGIDGGGHAAMTGRMLEAIESTLLAERPDRVLVYGDTNSTLAGALAAAKLNIPVAHVEAGLRCGSREMPEEINRVVTDRVSSMLFCPTQGAVHNLEREGIVTGVHHVGDVMCDGVLRLGARAARESRVLDRLGLHRGGYLAATFHRAGNTDDPDRAAAICRGLSLLSRETTVILPLHPRTRRALERWGADRLLNGPVVIEPIGYLDMLRLQQCARAVVTDSGGLQKEAFLLRVPCLTLRGETEWPETVDAGWNTLVGADPDALLAAYGGLDHVPRRDGFNPYGDGRAAERILQHLAA